MSAAPQPAHRAGNCSRRKSKNAQKATGRVWRLLAVDDGIDEFTKCCREALKGLGRPQNRYGWEEDSFVY